MRFALRNKDKLVNAFGTEAHQLLLDSLKDYARNHEDASCVLLVIGNYKKAPYTYKFQEIRDRKVARVKKMPLAKFKYLLDLFGGTPYITFKK